MVQMQPKSRLSPLPQNEEQLRFVLKRVDLGGLSAKERAAAHQEVKLLSQLDHPLVLGYVESFEHRGQLCIVTEYCEAGDLYHFLRKQGDLLPEEQVLDWFVQICLAIQYVHRRNVLHRDLKTQVSPWVPPQRRSAHANILGANYLDIRKS